MDVLDLEVAIRLKIAAAETRRKEAQLMCNRIREEILDLRVSLYLNEARTSLLPRFDSLRDPEQVAEFAQAEADLFALYQWASAAGSSLIVEIEQVKSEYDRIAIAAEEEFYRDTVEWVRWVGAGCPDDDESFKSVDDRIENEADGFGQG